MATCPNGHASSADDWCDVCGARIGGAPAASTADPSPASTSVGTASAAADTAGGDVTCPHCGITQDTGHRFCEVCGADLTTGSPGPTPATPPASADASSPPVLATWRAVVAPDRAYFDRLGADGVEFPVAAPARTFPLTDAIVLVGRRSERRGINPQIDLSGAPEDPGVSHAHCSLVRQPDGSYAVVDNGSTNGTFVNEATAPIAPNQPVPLADGDRVHLGAYTTVTVSRH